MTGSDLVARAKAGDRDAFEHLLTPLIEPAFQVALTVLGNRADAEDAVQEAAIQAWRRLAQLQDDGSLRAWFLAIVTNQGRMARRRPWSSVIKLPDLEPKSDGTAPLWTDHVELRHAIAQLGPADRMVLFLYFGLDLTLDEVATVRRLGRAGAKARLYRAVQRLRPGLMPLEDLG